jgi:S-formylglutathione hydrolase FrmB
LVGTLIGGPGWVGVAAEGPAAQGSNRVVEVAFSSAALGREKRFFVICPLNSGAGGGGVLVLLHGRGRNYRSLVELPETKEALLTAPYYVILPDGEDGWYVDSPKLAADRYEAYLEEVIQRAGNRFALSHDAGRWGIAGWSMGGYGAVRFAERHPGAFKVVASMIGLLDFPRPADLPSGQNYQVPVARFGADPRGWTSYNPSAAVEKLRGAELLVITAVDSFDRTMNERFVQTVRGAGMKCDFQIIPGTHTLAVVEAALPQVLKFAARFLGPPPETGAGRHSDLPAH